MSVHQPLRDAKDLRDEKAVGKHPVFVTKSILYKTQTLQEEVVVICLVRLSVTIIR